MKQLNYNSKTNNNKAKKYIIILILSMIAFPFNLYSQDRNKLEKEKIKLEKEIASMNKILNETKKTKKMSTSELRVLEKKIAQRKKLIKNINSQMGMLNNEIKSTQQSIGELCKEITILRESYAQMLRYAQKNKTNTDKLLFIFSSKDYKEAYQRYIFFRQFGDLQKEKLAQIQSKTNELSKRTNELELKRTNQEKLLQQELKNSKELNKEKTEKQKTVNQLQKKEKQLAKNLKDKQKQVKKLQQQIDNAIAAEVKKQKELAAKKKQQMATNTTTNKKEAEANKAAIETAKKKNYTIATTPEEVALSSSFEANKGKLPWPTSQGVIVSQYGVHKHPEVKGAVIENKGIDIRTTKGSTVRSIFKGEVSRVAKGPTGLLVVIIRHGEYMSVYANLKSVSVKNGQKVDTKQTIGTVSTNEDGVSEYKFQIFKGTHHLNPSIWLSK
ncbi:MAG: peptidoglycan DD-metalloendopeptidase family protein [Bacteroidales bacterium]|nr:peptidoglycan DD-metalloendopeptidase family protein [Bacteroidales bacterium]MEE1226445.1 peptidoglycan DD-metalloendopeptidase family protein [Bacteroidales bacterium]